MLKIETVTNGDVALTCCGEVLRDRFDRAAGMECVKCGTVYTSRQIERALKRARLSLDRLLETIRFNSAGG